MGKESFTNITAPILINHPKHGGILMEFKGGDTIGVSKVNATPKNVKWEYHGDSNLLPQTLLKLVWDNDIKPELLNTEASFLVGRGPQTFREEIVEGKIRRVPENDDQISNWKGSRKKTAKYLREFSHKAALNLKYFNNCYVEFIVNEARNGIADIHCHDTVQCRAGKPDETGHISNYFICGDWSGKIQKVTFNEKEPEKGSVKMIPAYDPENPFAHDSFMVHYKVWTPGNPIYGIPSWYGTRNWTALSNNIPQYHQNGLENGYNIRWHIRVPESYLDRFKSDEDKRKAKEELRDSLDEHLSGVENVGKGIISFFKTMPNGVDVGKWEIEPLETETNDEAFSKLYEIATQANAMGHGIDPSLAGIMIQGKLSSGSEKRNSYLIYMALKTLFPREQLVAPIELVHELNGWNEDLEWWFMDTEITKLDENPTGIQITTT